MDLVALTEELRELLEYEFQKYSVTQPIPKLRKKSGSGQGYSDKSGASPAKTNASRPSSLAKSGDDGDGTKAGVKHKDVPGTKASAPRGRDSKTQATPGTKAKGGTGTKPPSCPGGQQPRMVFGKWRCAGGSGGAQKAKARIATKRKQKPKKKQVQKGTLAKLIGKARDAFKGLFK